MQHNEAIPKNRSANFFSLLLKWKFQIKKRSKKIARIVHFPICHLQLTTGNRISLHCSPKSQSNSKHITEWNCAWPITSVESTTTQRRCVDEDEMPTTANCNFVLLSARVMCVRQCPHFVQHSLLASMLPLLYSLCFFVVRFICSIHSILTLKTLFYFSYNIK